LNLHDSAAHRSTHQDMAMVSAQQSSSDLLITGATGRVGGAIAARLAALGIDVRAAHRTPPKVVPERIHPVRFDLLDRSSHAPALAGVRRLFLLWPPGTNARTAIPPFLEAAQRAGVEAIVFLSVFGADRIRVVPHYAVERMLADSSFRAAILRPAYFFQNLSTTHREDIRLRDELFVPAGGGRTAMIDVRDVADLGARLLRAGVEENVAYDLTGEEAPTFAELAQILSGVLGRRIDYRRPGLLRFLREAGARGYPRGLALFMAAEYSVTRLGLAGRCTPDLSQALGRPPTSFQEFAREHSSVWRAE